MKAILTFAAALSILCVPGCVFAAGNRASAQDVQKPPSDPPVPESKYMTADFEGTGLSEVLYQAPPDRMFMIKDLRSNVPVSLVAEVAGNIIDIIPEWIAEPSATSSIWTVQLFAGAKLPAGAALRARRSQRNPGAAEVQLFFAGELVRI